MLILDIQIDKQIDRLISTNQKRIGIQRNSQYKATTASIIGLRDERKCEESLDGRGILNGQRVVSCAVISRVIRPLLMFSNVIGRNSRPSALYRSHKVVQPQRRLQQFVALYICPRLLYSRWISR